MKKIWPWVGLLLLLMILCIWTKIDTIFSSQQNSVTTTSVVPIIKQLKPINFDIVQKSKDYELSGVFKDMGQQQALVECFAENGYTLMAENTSTNQELIRQEAIALVEKITPHFVKYYKNGHISFHNNILRVEGIVDSGEAKEKMQTLLSHSSLKAENNTQIVLIKKPITFGITKEADELQLDGTFANEEQSQKLIKSIESRMSAGNITQDKHYVDTQNTISFVEKILPCFADQYTKGHIGYKNEILTIEGLAKDQSGLDELNALLQDVQLKVVNHTRLDPELEKARLAELAAKKAAQDAEKAEAMRLAKEAALARAKAEEEALARAKAEEEAKKNIAKLMEIENIEFEVAKDTLTPQGLETVNKLVKILKNYPSVRTEIAGYTDSDGNDEFNFKLSQARVDSVKRALVEQGIDAIRLEAKGYGEANPLLPNTTDGNKQANRRVEIHILGE